MIKAELGLMDNQLFTMFDDNNIYYYLETAHLECIL